MKIIITETQYKNLVESKSKLKDSLIDMIKKEGWDSAAELIGGNKNLAKFGFDNNPMNYLNLFNDLDVVQSKSDPYLTLFRYEERKNMMVYNKEKNYITINHYKIWLVLSEIFGLNYDEVQEVIKIWLFKVYKISEVRPLNTLLSAPNRIV